MLVEVFGVEEEFEMEFGTLTNLSDGNISIPIGKSRNFNFDIQIATSQFLVYDCQENFYREEMTNFCVADCFTWKPFTTEDNVLLASSLVTLLISAVVLVVAVLRAKNV